MSRGEPRLDWEGLLWETRGFLGLDDDAPVPLDELRETAEANGWSEREFREAHRNADRLVNVGTLDNPRVVLDDTESDTGDEESDSRDDTPRVDSENPVSNWGSNGEKRENVNLGSSPELEQGVFPEDLKGVTQWLTWKATDDGRKVPRAPYEHPDWPDKFVSAQDPDVWRDFDTAADWCNKLGGYDLAFTIRNRDEYPDERFVLVDYDDARDPDTGEIHPVVREHIERAGSYSDISTSGTGVHIFCRGELPEGVKAIGAELPEDDQFPDAEIEVYDSGRYSAMTGNHIVGTPRTTRECQSFINDLVDEFATVAEGTPDQLLRTVERRTR
ncbi:hypothetical protein [Salinigranum halophilum]|uniref:hypothetical protein n=1 Tax=Salinigranum halophilum TaxID=2565931 RepID=UPI001F373D78|nr:hypothetical protein [Salinigranum halophilum]